MLMYNIHSYSNLLF